MQVQTTSLTRPVDGRRTRRNGDLQRAEPDSAAAWEKPWEQTRVEHGLPESKPVALESVGDP